ncbi:MAG: response regulator, partial [Gracilibacteraceae bacterium]|nr:response regulator [Gracilibacteraceae bacterium]
MKKERIMLVDDVEVNRVVLKGILESEYDIVEAASGTEALDVLKSESAAPSIVLLDIVMPVVDGYEVLKYMKSQVHTVGIPVIMISAEDSFVHESKALSLGAVDFIPIPFNPDVVKIRISNHLRLKNHSETVENMVERKTVQLTNTREKVLETLTNIIEYRDIESGLHVKRTGSLMEILLKHVRRNKKYGFDITQYDQDLFLKSVPLHDIGKIAIPDCILQKPARLTPEEYETI